VFFVVPVAFAAMASLQSDADAVRLEPVVQRYLDRGVQHVTTYRAFRRLEAEGMGQTGWLEAWTELRGHSFRYDITAEGGSDGVRGRVLRKVLENEQQAWVSGEVLRSELTTENYQFERSPDQPNGLLKIPRRARKAMLTARCSPRNRRPRARGRRRCRTRPLTSVDIRRNTSTALQYVSSSRLQHPFASKAGFGCLPCAQINGGHARSA
jgi:hypothetical protein